MQSDNEHMADVDTLLADTDAQVGDLPGTTSYRIREQQQTLEHKQSQDMLLMSLELEKLRNELAAEKRKWGVSSPQSLTTSCDSCSLLEVSGDSLLALLDGEDDDQTTAITSIASLSDENEIDLICMELKRLLTFWSINTVPSERTQQVLEIYLQHPSLRTKTMPVIIDLLYTAKQAPNLWLQMELVRTAAQEYTCSTGKEETWIQLLPKVTKYFYKISVTNDSFLHSELTRSVHATMHQLEGKADALQKQPHTLELTEPQYSAMELEFLKKHGHINTYENATIRKTIGLLPVMPDMKTKINQRD